MNTELRIVLAIALVVAIGLIIRYRRGLEVGPLLVAIAISGCAADPGMVAVTASNSAAALEKQAAPLLKEHCVDLIDTATDAELEKLKEVCVPLMLVYASVYAKHTLLNTGLLVYQAAKDRDPQKLLELVFALGAEAEKLLPVIIQLTELAAKGGAK